MVFEFRVVLPLDWLPHKALGLSLSYFPIIVGLEFRVFLLPDRLPSKAIAPILSGYLSIDTEKNS